MKKSVLFIALLLVMTNFVVALHQCQGSDPTKHGVFIGECFECGGSPDGICPEDFGATCSPTEDPDCDSGTTYNVFWSLNNNTEIADDPLEIDGVSGITLYMVVDNVGMADGTTVKFNVQEDDPILDDDLGPTGGINGTVQGGKAIGAIYLTELKLSQDGDEVESIYDIKFQLLNRGDVPASDILKINITNMGGSLSPRTCVDLDITQCNTSLHPEIGVSEGEEKGYPTPSSPCKRKINLIGCKWNATTSICKQDDEIIYNPFNPSTCDESTTSCSYSETGKTDCNSGDDFFKVTYSSATPGCDNWVSGAIPCPLELKVPFFGAYGFILSLCFISLIYAYLIFKKE